MVVQGFRTWGWPARSLLTSRARVARGDVSVKQHAFFVLSLARGVSPRIYNALEIEMVFISKPHVGVDTAISQDEDCCLRQQLIPRGFHGMSAVPMRAPSYLLQRKVPLYFATFGEVQIKTESCTP